MKFYSLAKCVKVLKNKGLLLEIDESINTELEAAEIADRIAYSKNSKAILFKNNGSDFPLLMNIFANESITDDFLNLKGQEGYFFRLKNLFSLIFAKPKLLSISFLKNICNLRNLFPYKVKRGSCMRFEQQEPNLNLLPIIKCYPHDAGRFITLPLVHTIDPYTGQQNMGMYRMQVFDENTTGMHWHIHKGGAEHYNAWKKLGKKMPITVTLGGDPSIIYAASAPLPEQICEHNLTGFLKNKKVKLVKSKTNNIWVPECSDFVLEGYINTQEALKEEGPFGDHTGFYSLPDLYPIFHITKISYRKNAIYPAILVGTPPKEDRFLGYATNKIFLPLIQQVLAPEIVDLFLPEEGGFHNLALVKIKNKYPCQTHKVMHTLWGAGQMMFCKIIMVFDESIDIRNKEHILSAIDKNFRPNKDLLFSIGPSDVLDHAAKKFSFGGKVGLDCTTKNNYFSNVENSIEIIYSDENEQTYLEKNKKIIIKTDTNIKKLDEKEILWYILSTIDPLRDFSLEKSKNEFGYLKIDATSANKTEAQSGQWPAVAIMNEETIDLVNKKWNNYKIGDFVQSPSLRFKAIKSKGYLRDW